MSSSYPSFAERHEAARQVFSLAKKWIYQHGTRHAGKCRSCGERDGLGVGRHTPDCEFTETLRVFDEALYDMYVDSTENSEAPK